MPDTLIRPTQAAVSTVASVLAELNAVREVLNGNEDESQARPLGKAYGKAQARFVRAPVKSLADAITKLEFVVGEDALDSIDEDIIQGVIDFLRSQVAT